LRRVLGRRGVSEVFGALMLAMVMLAVTVAYVTFELQRTSREVHGIVDLIRTADSSNSQPTRLQQPGETGTASSSKTSGAPHTG